MVFDVPLPNEEDGARILSFVAQSHQLSLPAERFQRLVRGALGLTEEEIKRMYNRILLSDPQMSERALSLQIEEKQRAIRKSRFLEFWDTQQLELDVGGLDSLKQWLGERQLAFSEEAQAYGLPQPKGLFLLGVQGCGKSLMAKSVADRWKLPLLRLDDLAGASGPSAWPAGQARCPQFSSASKLFHREVAMQVLLTSHPFKIA